MNAQIELIEGTNRDVSKSQYFTPPKLAAKLVEWAGVGNGVWNQSMCRQMRVLEPSAGNGAIVRPLVAAGAEVTAIELDERYACELADALKQDSAHVGHDFLSLKPGILYGPQDLVCGNLPFHLDTRGEFTLHALEFAPRVCAIYPADVFYTVTRAEGLWSKVRPTRVAFCSRRPWKGAETDYCALELVKLHAPTTEPGHCELEWWQDAW